MWSKIGNLVNKESHNKQNTMLVVTVKKKKKRTNQCYNQISEGDFNEKQRGKKKKKTERIKQKRGQDYI